MRRIFLNVPFKTTASVIAIAVCIFFAPAAQAQCTNPVAAFPYHEDFENSDGNWFATGVSSDWAWGTPTKTVINKAGSGSKCWITGGLSGNSYNSGEYAWVQSPCFDFSSLDYPYLTFKIFWETEWNYDGSTLEYSLDDGNSWQTAGEQDYITNDCLNSNWYNNKAVVYLSNRVGWSGNIQPPNGNCLDGNGSGKWLDAKVTLPVLAHKPKVIFRFLFAAGTQCNSYDGFAFDDFNISEAPPNAAEFGYACTTGNVVQFTNNSAYCPHRFAWDFDDPNSAGANVSALENPIHTFSAPGTYHVTFTVSSDENAPSTIVKDIAIIVVNEVTTTNVSCNGLSDGTATVSTNGSGPFTYSWSTVPVQTTAIATNLKAGAYTVTVNAANSCTASKDFTITEPLALAVSLQTMDAVCTSINGQITANVSGGTSPYSYTWTPANNNAAIITGLAPATYNLSVQDGNGCTSTANATVGNVNPLKISLGKDTILCPGTSFQLMPGTFSQYTWQDNSTAPVFTVNTPGSYSVKVTDLQGCTASDTINVVSDCGVVSFPTAFTPNGDRLNDDFGPHGTLSFITNYRLIVYNRWGQLVFESTDPYKRWKGMQNGNIVPGIYVWFAKFNYREAAVTQKGTLTLLK